MFNKMRERKERKELTREYKLNEEKIAKLTINKESALEYAEQISRLMNRQMRIERVIF